MSEVNLRSDVQSVLAQMRALRAEMGALEATPAQDKAAPAEPTGSFSTMLRAAIDSVNSTQQASSDLASAFARGETDDLVGVMLASQKSSVSFQGMVHTRNRLVSAYQEIMQMPI